MHFRPTGRHRQPERAVFDERINSKCQMPNFQKYLMISQLNIREDKILSIVPNT